MLEISYLPLRGIGRQRKEKFLEGRSGESRGEDVHCRSLYWSSVALARKAASTGVLKGICLQPFPSKGKKTHTGVGAFKYAFIQHIFTECLLCIRTSARN